ncbi:MAG: hypothetical protein OHK0046_41860 [Anaerolineae bacterium]
MAHQLATIESISPQLNVKVEAHFNPETLEIQYIVEQAENSVGSGTNTSHTEQSRQRQQRTGYRIKLSRLDLLFDTTRTGEDVRKYTLEIARLLFAEGNIAPTVRFTWGTLIFKGTIDGMTETLDYFSEQGVPLRAQVSLEISMVPDSEAKNSVESEFERFSAGAAAGVQAISGLANNGNPVQSSTAATGTTPLTLASAGQNLQSMASAAGLDWKEVAAANNIDNPRDLVPGSVLNLNPSALSHSR